MTDKIKVGITHGDINGIGYEIIIKTLMDTRICDLCTPIVYGSPKIASIHKKTIEGADGFSFNIIASAKEASGKRANIIACVNEETKLDIGVSTEAAGVCAVESLTAAMKDLRAGAIDVLVTAPINKKNIQGAGFRYMGHTDYLAASFEGSEPLMFMVSDVLKVGLATTHLPLSEVTPHINKEVIVGKLAAMKRSLVRDFGIVQPKIAVLALNPHAGDEGLLGTQDQEIIRPAVIAASEAGTLAFGPFAADGFFGSSGFSKFDAVLAMYHDQGLAPFKALAFDSGVNFTAGLPIVRTSPVHGVGYDIAGRGIADESSLREAIYKAIDIFRNRATYDRISANPLKHYDTGHGADESVPIAAAAEEPAY